LAALEGFLLDQRSEHTRRAYSKDIKRFVKYLLAREAERGPEPVGRTVLIAYKDSLLGEGLEHTTIDRHLATLRTFFRWLRDEGLIATNPAEGVRFLKPRRVSGTEGFTDEEVRRILALPDVHRRTGAQHFAILMTLFHCGLRRGELCALRTSRISEERGHWILKLQGKGNRERIVVLVPEVYRAIRHHMRMNGKSFVRDEWLFSPVRNNRTGETGKPLDPSMVFWLVRRYARQAGVVKRVSPHSCRATAISHARDRNVPDRAIQDFAGWASPDMITRYDKRRTAVDQSAAHAIDYGGGARELPDGATVLPPPVSSRSK
jgi:integrase/recombinase XerD